MRGVRQRLPFGGWELGAAAGLDVKLSYRQQLAWCTDPLTSWGPVSMLAETLPVVYTESACRAYLQNRRMLQACINNQSVYSRDRSSPINWHRVGQSFETFVALHVQSDRLKPLSWRELYGAGSHGVGSRIAAQLCFSSDGQGAM